MSKFRYYITSEDYSILGTNDEELAEQYKETDCCSVIDTHEDVYYVNDTVAIEIKESQEDPDESDEEEEEED